MAASAELSLTFLGGAGTVTGSKFLITCQNRRFLIDCGLFQGLKELRLKNWAPLSVEASSIDAVILTHAHIDHSGYLPRLFNQGFRGPVYSTEGTFELAKIMLPDSARIMEEEAEYANQQGYSKHKPALPLFTTKDAHLALSLFHPVKMQEEIKLAEHLSFELHHAGHILGSAFCQFHHRKKSISLGFSGDVGRPNDPIMKPPSLMPQSHYLILESTYGDRKHSQQSPLQQLEEVVNHIREFKSVCVIPAFAVGRTQEVLYFMTQLKKAGKLQDIPVYLDSPMATSVSDLYWRFADEHRLSHEQCKEISEAVIFVRNADHSIALLRKPSPKIIISASGMATGGRVLHHLRNYLGNPNNIILFTGYQAEGTRGRSLIDGHDSVKIHGGPVPVRAQVRNIESLSAHADQDELVDWLRRSNIMPRKVFVTHGESHAAEALANRLQEEFLWDTVIPQLGDNFELIE